MNQFINYYVIGFLLVCCALSCNNDQETKISRDRAATAFSIIEIVDSNTTPTVDLPTYKLVVDLKTDRTRDAAEILKVKRRWPLAMQSLNPAEFESILAKDFTFKGGDTLFNRADYIKNRTTPDEWKIVFVKYENVTLQFFADLAMLSYVNQIRNIKSTTGEVENERISWVDVFVKENGSWKIKSSHSIDYRLEK